MAENEDTRLRKAGRWGLYGAAGGAGVYGLRAASLLRGTGWKGSLPIVGLAGAFGAMRGGAVGAGLGALTYRKNKVRELSQILDDLIQFQDPRPRDLQGQFERQGEGGPDPNSMATVYKDPKAMGVGRFAGAALAGGAIGAVGAQAGKAGWNQAAKIVKRLAAKRKSMLVK